MKTTKVYIHKKDLAYLAKHPGDNGTVLYLSKTECAEVYAGRCDMSFEADDSVENYPHTLIIKANDWIGIQANDEGYEILEALVNNRFQRVSAV